MSAERRSLHGASPQARVASGRGPARQRPGEWPWETGEAMCRSWPSSEMRPGGETPGHVPLREWIRLKAVTSVFWGDRYLVRACTGPTKCPSSMPCCPALHLLRTLLPPTQHPNSYQCFNHNKVYKVSPSFDSVIAFL